MKEWIWPAMAGALMALGLIGLTEWANHIIAKEREARAAARPYRISSPGEYQSQTDVIDQMYRNRTPPHE